MAYRRLLAKSLYDNKILDLFTLRKALPIGYLHQLLDSSLALQSIIINNTRLVNGLICCCDWQRRGISAACDMSQKQVL